MPTENRPSNTEMVSALRKAFTTSESGNGEYRIVMKFQNLPDMQEGREHLARFLAQTHAHPHPEPIAWMVGTAIWWTKVEAERDATATGLPMIPFGPLTGSAELEQLREVIKHSDSNIQRQSLRISNQRAHLAEWDALLRDSSGKLIRIAAHLISAPLFALQDLQDEDKKMTRARVDAAVESADSRLKDAAYELRRIADALYASAEPSAPTPQTISGHKLNCKAVDDYKPGECSCGAEPEVAS